MTRRTLRVVAVLLVVLAVAASGCFTIRGMSMTNKALGPGERTILRFDLMPYSSGATQTNMRVFILVGWNNADRVLPARFDTTENWGGPYRGRNNTSLAARLLTGSICGSYGVYASDLQSHFDEWEAWSTDVNIDATGLTRADFDLELRSIIRMQRPQGMAAGGLADGVTFSGGWNDKNGNNAWDQGEDVICTGSVFWSIPYVGN
jgi:hypothetical protein